uniref:peptidylprolyl isomerase n=1 Tax=Sus scrofa TaxID=9823 RepID=A0A8D0V2H9_PIG
MRLSWVLTVLSICLSALVTATGAEGKRKLQIGVKKRVDHCPIKSRKGDVLHMHYTGKLEDGTEFDSSLPQNQPFVFSLGTGQVIKGWDQGLLGMCEGEKRKLVIPSELGKRVLLTGDRVRGVYRDKGDGCFSFCIDLHSVPASSKSSCVQQWGQGKALGTAASGAHFLPSARPLAAPSHLHYTFSISSLGLRWAEACLQPGCLQNT